LPLLEKLLLQHLPQAAHILDLGCGTGQIAQQLLNKGYRVTGLDASEGMLNYARNNAPTGKFLLEDARFFKLPSSFHAVLSTTAALNHLMSLEELKSVFQNVYSALLENGLFLFDLNMEEDYKLDGLDDSVVAGDVKDDYAWAYQENYRQDEKISQAKVTIFQLLEGQWQRSNVTWLTKAYSKDKVQSALETVGFREVCIYTSQGDLAESEKERSLCFLCHR
jgi:SAM-dependent methyltransferase